MYLNSKNGNSGDQLTLYSPYVNLTEPKQFTFYYNMFLNAKDTTTALSVYTFSDIMQQFERQLFMASGNQGNLWQLATMCLPVGVYRLAFVGTIGMRYLSDLAIDDISFTTNPCSPPTVSIPTGYILGLIFT